MWADPDVAKARREHKIRRAIEANRPNVAVGQIWQDCDKRMGGRRVRVVEILGDYALCRNVTATGVLSAPTREVQLRLDRMRPTSTGWRRVDGGEDR